MAEKLAYNWPQTVGLDMDQSLEANWESILEWEQRSEWTTK